MHKPIYVTIRAFQLATGRKPDTPARKMVGEVAHFYELKAREKRDISVKLFLTVPLPDMISVKVRQKEAEK